MYLCLHSKVTQRKLSCYIFKFFNMPEISRTQTSRTLHPLMTAPQSNPGHADLVEKYKDTRFADILAANPYLNPQRELSGWEKLLKGLGFRTKYDSDMDAFANSAREYDAQVAQLASEEQYNSPTEAAARMAMAGLNPQLQGLENAGSASEFAQEQTPPTLSEGADPLSSVAQLANMVTQVISMSSGFSKDIFAMKQMQQQLEAGDIENAGKMMEYISRAMEFMQPHQAHGDTNYSDLFKDIAGMGLSKRSLKKFSNYYEMMKGNVVNWTKDYKTRAEGASARKAYLGDKASQYYSQDDDTMIAMMEPIIKLAEDVSKAQLETEQTRQGKDLEYEQNRDPQSEAMAEVAGNQAATQNAKIQKGINTAMAKIVGNLAQKAGDGNVMANVALLLFQVVQGMSASFGKSPAGKSGELRPHFGIGF